MNSILQVKLQLGDERNNQKYQPRNLRTHAKTTTEKMDALIETLKAVLRYYRSIPRILDSILIDVNYNDIIAKSNRIRALLKPPHKDINDVVVGARFSDAPNGSENHIITYYVDTATIENTLVELEIARRFLSERLDGTATVNNFKKPGCVIQYDGYGLPEPKLRDIIIDCSVVDSFSVPHISNVPAKDSFLITFYKTELSLTNLLEKLEIDEMKYRYSFYGNDTISVSKGLFNLLNDKVPYMISMISSDLSKITFDDIEQTPFTEQIYISDPSNEPIIGVIDTLFDDRVYFHNWVENVDFLDTFEQTIVANDRREHGTEVTSILVDGPRLNPWLDDGCGRFRVKHFGVCSDRISPARLVRKIKEIINQNPSIHVWNLSLGTEDEVSKNFISYDAAILDELQSQKNVIFVVSGTNDNRDARADVDTIKVGSPADSLNSLVVNAVRRDGTPTSYSRSGNVLSFFNKPDISYYGGDYDERIFAYSSSGKEAVYGTSFAAPWISRKLCYLIDVMGLPKEVAKALIIDASAGWKYKTETFKSKNLIGYGVVPIDISRILSTDSNEIKFIVYGTSKSYRTTNYSIPVPKDEDGKYPYIARATLCYFPQCSRSQGVDYTNRELSLRFGRVKPNGQIDDINENIQDEYGAHIDERQSRKEFRKWENTKLISKALKKNRPIKSYGDRFWGLAVTSKERLTTRTISGLNFGIIITLREINGVNRIQDFIRACNMRGYIVNELNIQNRLEIYNIGQEEIAFE